MVQIKLLKEACIRIIIFFESPVAYRKRRIYSKQKFLVTAQFVKTRAGHPILFSLFDILYSDTLKPVFDIDTPILFQILQSDTRYSITILSLTTHLAGKIKYNALIRFFKNIFQYR
jgi:hypothetical protein